MINLFVTFCTVYHLTLNLYRPLSFVRAHLLHRLWSTYTERYLLYLQYIAEGKSDKEQKYPWIEFLYCTQNKTHDDTTHLYDKEASKRHDRLHFIQSNSTVRCVDCEGEKKKKERKKKKHSQNYNTENNALSYVGLTKRARFIMSCYRSVYKQETVKSVKVCNT